MSAGTKHIQWNGLDLASWLIRHLHYKDTLFWHLAEVALFSNNALHLTEK
jgi:hypothetical protein